MGYFILEGNREDICKESSLFNRITIDGFFCFYELRDTNILYAPYYHNKRWLAKKLGHEPILVFDSKVKQMDLDTLLNTVTEQSAINILLFNIDIMRKL